jgi:hypothetical protein
MCCSSFFLLSHRLQNAMMLCKCWKQVEQLTMASMISLLCFSQNSLLKTCTSSGHGGASSAWLNASKSLSRCRDGARRDLFRACPFTLFFSCFFVHAVTSKLETMIIFAHVCVSQARVFQKLDWQDGWIEMHLLSAYKWLLVLLFSCF